MYNGFIHNAPKLKTTNERIPQLGTGRQTMVHPYNRILSNKKKLTTNTCNNMDKSQTRYNKLKEARLKGYMLYDCIYILISPGYYHY